MTNTKNVRYLVSNTSVTWFYSQSAYFLCEKLNFSIRIVRFQQSVEQKTVEMIVSARMAVSGEEAGFGDIPPRVAVASRLPRV